MNAIQAEICKKHQESRNLYLWVICRNGFAPGFCGVPKIDKAEQSTEVHWRRLDIATSKTIITTCILQFPISLDKLKPMYVTPATLWKLFRN